MTNTKAMSLGEQRVRYNFNPSQDSGVEEIKLLTAALINCCDTFKDKDPRLAA